MAEKWTDHIGAGLIKKISVFIGGEEVQTNIMFVGDPNYILCIENETGGVIYEVDNAGKRTKICYASVNKDITRAQLLEIIYQNKIAEDLWRSFTVKK